MGHPLAVGAPNQCGSKGTQPLPRCEPRGTPVPCLCSTSSYHIYMLPAGRREEDQLEKWLKGTTGECRMLRNRGSIRLPSPRRAFQYPQPLLLRSHDLCHRRNPAFSCKNFIIFSPARTLPSSSWPSPPPFLSESHRQERDQLDKNLNQCKCEIQRKKNVF